MPKSYHIWLLKHLEYLRQIRQGQNQPTAALRFPHRSHSASHGFLLERFVNAGQGQSHAKTLRCGPHRKTFIKADLRRCSGWVSDGGQVRRRSRPIAAIHRRTRRRSAASPDRSSKHCTALLAAQGQQCGQSASSLRLLERPLWRESKFKQQSARWIAPGTSFSSHKITW